MLLELPAERLSARRFYLFKGGLRYSRGSPKVLLGLFVLMILMWLQFQE